MDGRQIIHRYNIIQIKSELILEKRLLDCIKYNTDDIARLTSKLYENQESNWDSAEKSNMTPVYHTTLSDV